MIKVNSYNKAAPEYIHEKKDRVAEKMQGAGEEHLKSLQKKHGYSKEGTERYKKFFGMNQKGKQSLNPPKKGRDNEVMEGRNEQEKS